MTFKLTGRAKRNLNETREIGITTASAAFGEICAD